MRPNLEISGRQVTMAMLAIGLCIMTVVVVSYNGWGFSNKSLFDWLEVLVFPLAVGVGVPWLTNSQRAQGEREQQLEDQRWERAREIEEERAQTDALESYLDQMARMLLEERLLSPPSAPGATEVRSVARARTLELLNRLDSYRKNAVILFLTESELIQGDQPIIELAGANLQGAALREADLSDTNLRNTDLRGARLSAANLRGVALSSADLSDADLGAADLMGADLSDTNLSRTNLTDANFINANLINANLKEALLRGANLVYARLNEADLSGADLSGANGITAEELERQAYSLKGTNMPDGSTHD